MFVNRAPPLASPSMTGVSISPPKHPASEKPISSASTTTKLGRLGAALANRCKGLKAEPAVTAPTLCKKFLRSIVILTPGRCRLQRDQLTLLEGDSTPLARAHLDPQHDHPRATTPVHATAGPVSPPSTVVAGPASR